MYSVCIPSDWSCVVLTCGSTSPRMPPRGCGGTWSRKGFCMLYKIGAPKGGRVHWLLYNLRPDFKRAYECVFNYAIHNYVFVRYHKRKIYDVFIVVKTSRHCWTCTYANCKSYEYQRFSSKNTRLLALRMWFLFQKYRSIGEG